MKKLLTIALGIMMVPIVAATSVSALGRGQFPEGNFYYSPQNGVAVDPASATCGDTVTLKVRAHNAGPGIVENTTVSVALPNQTTTSHVSKATISSPYADPTAVSDTMTINLSKAGKLSYINGSAELLDASNKKLQSLPDTLTTSGVNIGTVNVSMQEIRFVQFKVKVDCPTPEAKKIKVCELASKKIITIDEKDFDSKKHSKNLADCAEAPKPGEITVCEVESGKVVTIKENEFDSSKYTKDLSKCAEKEVPVATELPRTGANGMVVGTVLSALVAGAAYALQRRNTLG